VVTAEISGERAWEMAFSVSARAGAQADDAQFQPAGHFFGHLGCHMNRHVGAEYLVNLLNTLDQRAARKFGADAEIDYHALHRLTGEFFGAVGQLGLDCLISHVFALTVTDRNVAFTETIDHIS
jgi:hypothetical protein